jgi:hypothetical protein
MKEWVKRRKSGRGVWIVLIFSTVETIAERAW